MIIEKCKTEKGLETEKCETPPGKTLNLKPKKDI
jgi:hypothetical protein